MAKLQMQKIEMIALLKDSKSIVERLQRRGVMEIHSTDNDVLLNIRNNRKESMLSSLKGRKSVSTDRFAENKDFTDETLSLCYSVLECSKKITDCNNEIAKLETHIDVLKPWVGLELSQSFKGTRLTRSFIGTFPDEIHAEDIENQLIEADENAVAEVDIISSRKEQTCAVVTCHKSVSDTVFALIRDMGFAQLSASSTLTPADEVKKLEEKVKDNCKKIKECEEYSFAKDYTVDRNFIDINNHMNNVCYMELADIVLPENVYLKGDCNEFEIMYRKAIKYGEKIKCLYTEIEDSHIIAIKSEDLSELKAIIKMYK